MMSRKNSTDRLIPIHPQIRPALAKSSENAGASPKKDLILILTDGEPDGGTKPAIAKTIIEQANSQDADDDCTICFIQLGNDAGATAFLKSLDDDLKGAKFDIVDAITAEDVYKAPSLAHVLKAAITG